MSEGLEQSYRPTDKVGRVLFTLTKWLALFGGAVVGLMEQFAAKGGLWLPDALKLD